MRKLLWVLAAGSALLIVGIAAAAVVLRPPRERPSARPQIAPLPTPPLGRELSSFPGVSIKRVGDAGGFGSWSVESGYQKNGCYELKAKGADLGEVLARAGDQGRWLYDDAGLPEGRYDIFASVRASDEAALRGVLEKAYAQAFKVRIAEKDRECDVYVLSRLSGKPRGLRPATSQQSFCRTGGPGWEFGRQNMEQFAEFLEKQLEEPVLDETGLQGEYDFEMASVRFHREKLPAEMKRLGLKLEKARRVIKAVVIERAGN